MRDMTGSDGVEEDDDESESDVAAGDSGSNPPSSSPPYSPSSSSPSSESNVFVRLAVSVGRAGRIGKGDCNRACCCCWAVVVAIGLSGEKDEIVSRDGRTGGRVGRTWLSSMDGRREPLLLSPPPPPIPGDVPPRYGARLPADAVRRIVSAEAVLTPAGPPPVPPPDNVRPIASDVKDGEFIGESRPAAVAVLVFAFAFAVAAPSVATFRVCARTWETWRSVRMVAWMRRKSTVALKDWALRKGVNTLHYEGSMGVVVVQVFPCGTC